MAQYFGVRTYRVNIPTANTPLAIWTSAIGALGHQRFVESFEITADSGNGGNIAIGGSDVTIATGNSTDGIPLSATDFRQFGVDPKTSSLVSEFDMSLVYVVAATAGDDFYITYISKG